MPDSIKLGPRLNCIASLIVRNARLADIGTDHAYLPIVLCERGKIERAIAIDIHQGPYESALAAVKNHKLEERIDVRLGDGLQPLVLAEIDTLSLAGMGGKTMLEILFARPDILAEVTELIVQPQGLESKVRYTLLEAGWLLKEEYLVEEEGRIYTVIAFSRRTGYSAQEILEKEVQWIDRILLSEIKALKSKGTELTNFCSPEREIDTLRSLFWQFGPLILEEPNQLLKRLIQEFAQELTYREEQMRKSANSRVETRRLETLLQLYFLECIMH